MDDDAFNDLGYDEDTDEIINNYDEISSSTAKLDQYVSNPVPQLEARGRRGFELGDLSNPLDWHMKLGDNRNSIKRRKLEQLENAISATTFQILEAKRQAKNISIIKNFGDNQLHPNSNLDDFKKLTKYPPINGVEWFGLSSADNFYRGYLAVRKSRINKKKTFALEWEAKQNCAIASQNFCLLIEEVRIINESMQENNFFNYNKSTQLIKNFSNSLWIEKYAPQNFFDLVTEDEHNRLVLMWLKSWDKHVFHKNFNVESLSERDLKFLEYDSKRGLPKFKIMILQGSSGIGKSVLANIAAKQAGYKPFVIAITEIQNLNELRLKLDEIKNLGSIESFMLGKIDKKPTCLIIDGVDYATSDMIKLLSNWSLITKKTNFRPIICTCNNLYTSNLRGLRSHCLIIKMATYNKQRLIKRLQDILKLEKIKISDVNIQSLIEMYKSDIRLCLNTMQFYYTFLQTKQNFLKNDKLFVLEKLQLTKNDESNTESSIFEAMDAILTLDHHVDSRGISLNLSQRLNRIRMLISKRDDLDRFYQALFHNFTDAIKITNAQRRKAAEYFIAADLNHRLVYTLQNFTLFKYQCYIAFALHICVAVHVSRRLIFNLSFITNNEHFRESIEIVRSVRNNAMRNGLSLCLLDLTHDILPFLYKIIQPNIQAVNIQLFSFHDLLIIQRVVAIMNLFKLTYILKYEEIEANYCLDPAIKLVVVFTKERFTSEKLSNNLKKYIAHQIELTSIRGKNILSTQTLQISNTSTHAEIFDSQIYHNDIYDYLSEGANKNFNNNKGIPVTPLAMKKRNDSTCFVFRYIQGCSKAVRRNIRINELFK